MKKNIIFQIVIVFFTIMINAQETKTGDMNKILDNTYKNSIRLLPLPTLFGSGINIEYERLIKNNWSLNIQAFGESYTSDTNRIGSRQYTISTNIVQIEIDGRYYLSKHKNALKGWFVGPGIIGGYKDVDVEEPTDSNNNDYEAFIIGGAVKSGYQWIFNSGFTIGLASGIEAIYSETSTLEPILEFSIGYSW
ncbi:DUF3575 domain-containing protein [Aquimarina sp. M1]